MVVAPSDGGEWTLRRSRAGVGMTINLPVILVIHVSDTALL